MRRRKRERQAKSANAKPLVSGLLREPTSLKHPVVPPPSHDSDQGRPAGVVGNLFQPEDPYWDRAHSGTVLPTVTIVEESLQNADGSTIRVEFPEVSGPSDFSLIYRHPAQTYGTKHRFTVYLRGLRGDEIVWLSHSPQTLRFTRVICRVSQEWQQFSMEYQSSDRETQYLHIGVDLRDPEQTPKPGQVIFLQDAGLFQLESPSSWIMPDLGDMSHAISELCDVTDDNGTWRIMAGRHKNAVLCDERGLPLHRSATAQFTPDRLIGLRTALAVLALRGAAGARSFWLFDADLRLVARELRPNTDSDAGVHVGGGEATAFAEAFQATLIALISDPGSVRRDRNVKNLMALNLETRRALVAFAWSATQPPKFVSDSHLSSGKAGIERILSLNWLDVTRRSLMAGHLVVPAISHDGDAFAARCIITDAYQAVVHVRDTPDSPPWLLLLNVFTLQHRYYGESSRAIVFPDRWTYISPMGVTPKDVHRWLGAALYLLCQLGGDAAGWATEPNKLGILGRAPTLQHMGHQIWNTNATLLRGIDAARSRGEVPPDFWDLSAAAGVEIFGPIEDIFPELAGHVHRTTNASGGAFIEAARLRQTLLFDVFHEVPVRLRTRMRCAIAVTPTIQEIYKDPDAMLLQEESTAQPVLVLGLRLQNRTAIDLLDFYVELSESIARHGKFTVILDGLTTNTSGEIFRVYSASGNDDHALNQEVAFEAQYRDRTAHLPLRIISCIGLPIRTCLFWLGFADIFVAPHGTGAAKYRWIHNIPGFLLTSEQNVRFGFALRIYEADGNVEEYSELYYTNPEEIDDILPTNRYVDSNGRLVDPWWLGLLNHNFKIRDRGALIQRISDLLLRTVKNDERPGTQWRRVLDAAGLEMNT